MPSIRAFERSDRRGKSRNGGHRSGGFSLLEAMVAVVVISIGLIGLAALQVMGVQNTANADYRTTAMIQSEAMADKMRANLAAYENGDFALLTAGADIGCRSGVDCTPAQVAQDDFFMWEAELGRLLPTGQGAVCVDDTPDDGVPGAEACSGNGQTVIKVFWRESRGGSSTAGGAADNVAGEDQQWRVFGTPVYP